MRCATLFCTGVAPGSISRHLATLESKHEIDVPDWKIVRNVEGVEGYWPKLSQSPFAFALEFPKAPVDSEAEPNLMPERTNGELLPFF